MKTTQQECNAAVQDLLASGVQQLFDDAERRDTRRKIERPSYPIMAMPIIGGDMSLACEVVEHRRQAIKVSNGVTELWLPRSQVRRIVGKRHVIISEWIYARKSIYFRFVDNQSPDYLQWVADAPKRERALAEFLRTSRPFGCQFDGTE